MPTSLSQQSSQALSSTTRPTLRNIAILVLLLSFLIGGLQFAGVFQHFSREVSPEPDSEQPRAASAADDKVPSGHIVLILPEKKLQAARLETSLVSRTTLTHEHIVPGRVAYNDNRHIAVTAPTGGILTQVLVKPGDQVQAGQTLAWLNSPEIGTARADVLQRQTEAEITTQLADRAATVERNVNALADAVKNRTAFETVRKQFSGRLLGDYRDKLLAAYSQTLLSDALLDNSASLAESGAISGKTMEERKAAARSDWAALEAACEQIGLNVWKERANAEAAAHDAKRRLQISRQHLAALLLSDAATQKDVDMPTSASLGATDQNLEHLSRVAVCAPFAGTIESRTYSASERVPANAAMFVLADTTTLWITAELRENDWNAVSIKPGQTLTVSPPALDHQKLTAIVEFIGREVGTATNAIPIVARIDNSQGTLRPGLFVRVSVPVGVRENVLVVPSEAVIQHDGASFVFVAEGPNRFRQVHVVTGEDGDSKVEIVRGLKEGESIVTHGAFVLKSELLLESEEG